MGTRIYIWMLLGVGWLYSCLSRRANTIVKNEHAAISCENNLPARFAMVNTHADIINGQSSTEGMVWIPGGELMLGASDDEGRMDEYPAHTVSVSGFWMDATEVTNAEFKKFVEATGYVTMAEKSPDWNEIKKQLPEGTAKPHDSLFVAASLVFTPLRRRFQ